MNWICLALVAAAWGLGHMTGYRLCKLRIKNFVRNEIKGHFQGMHPGTQAELDLCSAILKEVTEL